MEKVRKSGSDDKIKAAVGIIAECSGITDPDPCEAAIKVGACMKTNQIKRNISWDS